MTIALTTAPWELVSSNSKDSFKLSGSLFELQKICKLSFPKRTVTVQQALLVSFTVLWTNRKKKMFRLERLMFPIQRYTTSHVTGIVISCHYLFFCKKFFFVKSCFIFLSFFLLFKKCFDAPDKVKTSGEWNKFKLPELYVYIVLFGV